MLLCPLLLPPLSLTLPVRAARWHAAAALAPLPRLGTPVAMAGPPLVPKEIRDAEEKTPAAAGRGLRFAAFAALGGLAVATGVVYLAAAVGIGAVDELAEALVPFDNLYLGIALDGGVIATCVWLWRQELNTREENVQRIWAEVQRRRNSPKGSKAGRKEEGFTKKRKASRGSAKRDAPPARGAGAGAAGFGSSAVPAPAPPELPAAPPPAAEIGPPPGGFQKMWGELYDQADSMGRAQAVSLNSALEERGVLPTILPAEGSATGSGAAEGSAADGGATEGAAAGAASTAPPPAPAAREADGGAAAASPEGGRGPKSSKSKKKKKKR